MQPVDLLVDLNCTDDTGLPWALLNESADTTHIEPGRHLVVGSGAAQAVAQVIDIHNGIVHVRPLHGSVASNSHHLRGPAT